MTTLLRQAMIALGAIAICWTANAREIDSEKTISTEQIQLGHDLPMTVVVRIKEGTNQVEVLHSKVALKADETSKFLVSTSTFVKLDNKGRMVGELDRDSSSSSWFFCYPYNYYPYYNYCGYNYLYAPYYGYAYGGYRYSYYGWPYSNPYCYGYGYGYGGNPPGPAGGPGYGYGGNPPGPAGGPGYGNPPGPAGGPGYGGGGGGGYPTPYGPR